MKKLFLSIIISIFFISPSFAWNFDGFNNERAVKNVLYSQIKYANKANFDKFIDTYDKDYKNADGLNLEKYSELIKTLWETSLNLKYENDIKNIKIDNDIATVEVTEYSSAKMPLMKDYDGQLISVSDSVYKLRKKNGKWKVIYESVSDETTSMLYGDLKNLDIKLNVPKTVQADEEYSASLELIPPNGTLAIASLTSEKIEYPQKKVQEVFRAIPEDNILERLFTANSDNLNEYIIASIGLTKTDICNLSVKMSLAGFGYVIKRVNVTSSESNVNEQTK